MSKGKRVAVLGAAGHTGQFVISALREQGLSAIAVGRGGAERDARFERTVSFADDASLDQALAGADAVLNCAGPFFDTALPAASAAIRAGIPYLDISAEQWTVGRMFDDLDGAARERGVTIVPAMAFYGGLADLMVSALSQDGEDITSVEIATALDSWHPTAGTRLTGVRNTHPRMLIRNGELTPVPDPRPSRDWTFTNPFGTQTVTCAPMSEIVLLHRHKRIGDAVSYLNLKPLAQLSDPATPPPNPTDIRGRSSQQFVMDVRLDVAGRQRRALAFGQDIYASTAPILIAGCLSLISGKATKTGVQAPGSVFDARAILAAVESDISIRFSFARTDLMA